MVNALEQLVEAGCQGPPGGQVPGNTHLWPCHTDSTGVGVADKVESFLNGTPMAYALRSSIGKWHLIKVQSSCKAKHTVNSTKWQCTDWEIFFTNLTSDRGLISKIYKELNKLDSREPKNPIRKRSAELNREL